MRQAKTRQVAISRMEGRTMTTEAQDRREAEIGAAWLCREAARDRYHAEIEAASVARDAAWKDAWERYDASMLKVTIKEEV